MSGLTNLLNDGFRMLSVILDVVYCCTTSVMYRVYALCLGNWHSLHSSLCIVELAALDHMFCLDFGSLLAFALSSSKCV